MIFEIKECTVEGVDIPMGGKKTVSAMCHGGDRLPAGENIAVTWIYRYKEIPI